MAIDGCFVWHELRVNDLETDARFYGDLLGWAFRPHSMGSTILAGGVPVGGVSAAIPGLPNHWTPFVACSDVNVAASAARAGGGAVTTGEPADVPGMGRLAPILDPDKSIFAAITPGPAVPAEAPSGPGRFVWERLRTPGPPAALDFYAATLGWTAHPAPDGQAGVLERPDGTRVAEVIRAAPGESTGWLSFVHVDDLNAVRARTSELGGTADTPIEVPATGRFTVITDPKGATLAVFQPTPNRP